MAVLVVVAALGVGLALLVTRVLLPSDDSAAPQPSATGQLTPTGTPPVGQPQPERLDEPVRHDATRRRRVLPRSPPCWPGERVP